MALVFADTGHIERAMISSFYRVPETSTDRNKKKRYEKILKSFDEFLRHKSEEVLDALTDSVKDFLTPTDTEAIKDRLDKVFQNELGEDLRDRITAVENSLTVSEKNSVIKSKVRELEKRLSELRGTILSDEWGESEEDTEKYVTLSQVLDLSINLVKYSLDDIDWLSKEAVEDANELIGLAFFLILKFIAMTKEKVTMESLVYALSLVQIALEESEIAPFLRDVTA